jgi:hypothetical protein
MINDINAANSTPTDICLRMAHSIIINSKAKIIEILKKLPLKIRKKGVWMEYIPKLNSSIFSNLGKYSLSSWTNL